MVTRGGEGATQVLTEGGIGSCTQCGASSDCACSEMHGVIHQAAHALTTQAHLLARERRFHRSRQTFEASDALESLDSAGAIGLGLCCLALGDLRAAEAAWRRAAAAGAEGHRATALLTALHEPATRTAVAAYHTALKAARQGDAEHALEQVRRCREALPDLIPAARLELLVRHQRGESDEGALTLAARFPDDPVIGRLALDNGSRRRPYVAPPPPPTSDDAPRHRRLPVQLIVGLLLGASAGAAGMAITSSSRAVRTVRTVSPPAQPPSEAPAASPQVARSDSAGNTLAAEVAALAMQQDVASLARLRDLARSGKISLPEQAAVRLDERLEAAAHVAYGRARRLLAAGDRAAAVTTLRQASEAPSSAYFADDALYQLAVQLQDAGQLDEARAAAVRLQREHPSSSLLNSVTRRIATTPSPTLP